MPRPLRWTALVAAVIALAWLSARARRGATAPSSRPEASTDAFYAAVRVFPRVGPHGFFELPLPSTQRQFTDFRPPHHPPRAWVAERLCNAEPAMLARVEVAMRRAPETAAPDYGGLAAECPEASPLNALAHAMDGGTATQVALFSHVLAAHDLPALGKWSDDPRVPLHLRARWFGAYGPPRFEPAFATALKTAAADGGFPAIRHLFEFTAAIHRASGTPEAEPQLLALYQALPDGRARKALGRGFAGARDPRLREAAAASCREGWCARAPRDAGMNATEWLAAFEESPINIWDSDLPDGGREPAVREALAACALGAGRTARGCLEHLADTDWATARQVASRTRTTGGDVALLRAFDSPEAAATELTRLGLPIHAPAVRHVEAAFDESGTGRMAETWADYPAHNDDTASEYAGLARGALNDVVFLEALPEGGRAAYLLQAWMDDARYEVLPAFSCNVRDLSGVLGLLNVLLRDRRSSVRFYLVDVGGLTGKMVVAIAPATLKRLEALKLVTVLSARAVANEETTRIAARRDAGEEDEEDDDESE